MQIRQIAFIVLSTLATLSFVACVPSERKEPTSNALGVSGDWNSGGGFALTEALNPWFVQNTKEIRYCIEMNREEFGIDLTHARQAIREAFAYWRDELAYVTPGVGLNGQKVLLATQETREEECGTNTDLRFQLGTMNRAQIERYGQPQKYIARAIRESYDSRNLKGRGFIYVSPQFGPLRPDDHGVSSDRWLRADGKLLLLTLIHELGHIYGLTFSSHPLMDPALGFIYDNDTDSNWLQHELKPPSYFRLHEDRRYTRCDPDESGAILALPTGVSKPWPCVSLEIRYQASSFFGDSRPIDTIRVLGHLSRHGEVVELGQIRLKSGSYFARDEGHLIVTDSMAPIQAPSPSKLVRLFQYEHFEFRGKFVASASKEETPISFLFNGTDIAMRIEKSDDQLASIHISTMEYRPLKPK